MRRSPAAAAAAALAVVLTCGAAGCTAPAPAPARPITAAAPSPAEPSPSPQPAPEARPLTGAGGTGRLPDPAEVAAAVGPQLAAPDLGPAGHVHALVADAATGAPLFDRDAAAPVAPASTLKTLTAAAALTVLGPDRRLRTRVVTAAPLGADGVLAGDLFLVGAGDQTLTAGPATDPGQATVAALVAGLQAAGVRRVAGRVVGDGYLFAGAQAAPGWHPAYVAGGSVAPVTALEVDGGRYVPNPKPAPRAPRPDLAAARVLTADLRAGGVAVAGEAATARAPAGARELAGVDSAPVAGLVRRMLEYSDNDLAESLGRLVAGERGLPRDAPGAARAVLDTVAALGVPVAGARLSDTSGLSVDDRLPAGALVGVLRLAVGAGAGSLRPLALGLPLAGRSGTLDDRFVRGAAAAGYSRVHAKTGALLGVSTLAGWVVDGGGRLLVFALGTDAAASRPGAEAALDRAAAALLSVR